MLVLARLFLMTCLWVGVTGPKLISEETETQRNKPLGQGLKTMKMGKNSHTMEVSATHIVWCLSNYYCTRACLFHCHLQYFSASCFSRKMNQPAPLCLSKITKQNKKGLRTILVWWSASASVLPVNIQEDWFPFSPRDSQGSSPTPQFESISSSVLGLLYGPIRTSIHDYWKNHSFD